MTPAKLVAIGVAGGATGPEEGEGDGAADAPGTEMSATFAMRWNAQPSVSIPTPLPLGNVVEVDVATQAAVTTNTPYREGSIESMPAAESI
jgi:hypothetical protein